MIRLLLSLLLLLGPAAALAQQGRDYRPVVARAGGDIVVGSPKAPVRLTEYLSYSCPHCAIFVEQSAPVLKDRMVRGGSVRLVIRTHIRNSFDLAASLLIGCQPPAQALASHQLVFRNQQALLANYEAIERSDANPAAPVADRLRRIADGSGLSALVRARGMSDARIGQCLSNTDEADRMIAVSNADAGRIRATPSFAIGDGDPQPGNWSMLEPKLRAAGAR